MYRPGQLPGRASVISGELQAGGGIVYVQVWLECPYDPPEGHPGQHAYTFLIHVLSMYLTSVSIFSVCAALGVYLYGWGSN
jgi:hypothetical protein